MKTIVLKFSGKIIDNFLTGDVWAKTIKDLKEIFDAVIIVHGAGVKITEWSRALGLTPVFHEGLRVTDNKTMEVVAAVQSGLINGRIVGKLQANKINAVGLTGTDFNLFTAEKLSDALGFVGEPASNGSCGILESLLQWGVVPVFSSTCRNNDGELMNINADTFVKEIAITLKAETVLFFSDNDGVNLNDSIQSFITETDINDGIKTGHINEGMIPKLRNCIDLLNKGINKIWIGKDLSGQDIKENFFTLYDREGITNLNSKGTWIVHSSLSSA